jgi:hypothetical protein
VLPAANGGTGNTAGGGGMWQRNGTIMIGNSTEEYSAEEPMVMYENGQFEMWHTCGWGTAQVCYDTSTDGINFTRQNGGNPVLVGMFHFFIIKVGSTYYIYGVLPGLTQSSFTRYHSTDRVNWVLDQGGILPGIGGWDAMSTQGGCKGNIFVWIEGSTWYALYESAGTDYTWRTGEATSTDGLNWTPYAGNPVFYFPGGTGPGYLGSGMCGGPDMHKVGSTYYAWIHCAVSGDGPTDIYRWQSTDKLHWTMNPTTPVLSRVTSDEGPGANAGAQIADPMLIESNGSTYMYYSAADNQSPAAGDGMHIKVAIAPMTIAQLVTTNEGNGGILGVSGVALGLGAFGYGGPTWSPDGLQAPINYWQGGRFDIGERSIETLGSAVMDSYNTYWLAGTGPHALVAGYGWNNQFDTSTGTYHFQGSSVPAVARALQSTTDYLTIDKNGNGVLRGTFTANGITLTSTPLYSPNGTVMPNAHMVAFSGQLAGGTASVTFSGAAVFAGGLYCTGSDVSAASPVRVAINSYSSITITGTGTDYYAGICTGN